jgi:hypothetical protein
MNLLYGVNFFLGPPVDSENIDVRNRVVQQKVNDILRFAAGTLLAAGAAVLVLGALATMSTIYAVV